MKTAWSALAWLVVAAGLPATASGDPPVGAAPGPAVASPADTRPAGAETSLERATSPWPALGGQAAPGPASLTLEAVLDRVLRESPVREAAAVLAASAREVVPLAARWPNPLVEWRQENWTLGASDAEALRHDGFAVVTQPIELGGKRHARRQMAEADRAVADGDLAGVERQLALLVVDRYVAAVREREWTRTLADERDSLQELTDLLRRRVEEGAAAEADFRKLEAELTRVDAELLRAQLGLDAAMLALDALLGGDMPAEPARLVVPSPLPVPPFVSGPAFDAAVDRTPAVAVAQAEATRALERLSLERAGRIPDLAVSAGYKRTGGANTGVVGVVLPVPLFDRNGAAIARAAGDARAAALRLEAVRREARADIQATLRAARSLSSRSTRTPRELAEPAEVVRRAARALFREGSSDVLRLVDAERVYAAARRDALALTLDAVVATARARLILGDPLTP